MSSTEYLPSSQLKAIKRNLRKKLKSSIDVKYRIRIDQSEDRVKKKLFKETIEKLKKLEEKRMFLLEELGVDLTEYEQGFYEVIDNLLRLTYNKKQRTIIDLYLYGEVQDKDWDGQINILQHGKETTHPFTTLDHLWNVVQTLKE